MTTSTRLPLTAALVLLATMTAAVAQTQGEETTPEPIAPRAR